MTQNQTANSSPFPAWSLSAALIRLGVTVLLLLGLSAGLMLSLQHLGPDSDQAPSRFAPIQAPIDSARPTSNPHSTPKGSNP